MNKIFKKSANKFTSIFKYTYNFFINIKYIDSLIIFLVYTILYIFIINILEILYYLYTSDYYNLTILNVIPNGQSNDNIPMDPVRWWPSGVAQGWTTVGTALAVFAALSKLKNVSPSGRVLGALAGAGVAASQITYHSAIENPVGFNRLMYGLTEYNRTGKWPSLDDVSKIKTDSEIESVFNSSAVGSVDTQKVDAIVKEVTGSNNFLPSSSSDFTDFIQSLIDSIFKNTIELFQPVYVQGYLDDLLGQRIFIEIILFITSLLVILLFIIFIINLIILFNKDKIINKFKNKFILFYLNYITILTKITLLYIPIFIFIGLVTICQGSYWLYINQIPYDSIGIDLHQFITPNFSSET